MNISGTRKAIGLIRNVFDTTKNTRSSIEFSERKPVFRSNYEKYFERVTPESVGISSKITGEFINELYRNRRVALHSIMLMRNGKVFYEADTGNQDPGLPKATFSECKSVVALAIGKLVTQGKLKLSERVAEIFSDRTLPVAKLRLKGLTVRHLLTMTACVTFNESEAMVTEDWVKGFLNSDTEGEFGESFRYNSLNTYMLSAIIRERTEMSLSEYLDSTIFKSLEIKDYYWEKCPMGIEKGGWGLYIRREDMAKLGLLVMQKGYWNGRKLIASKYIEDMTGFQAGTPEEYGAFNYGFHTWCGRDKNSFLFNGMLGQNLLGYKDSGIMIIANCGNCDMFQQNDFFEICNRFLSGNFPDSLPENRSGNRMLLKLTASLKSKAEIKSFLGKSRIKRDLDKDIDAIDGKHFAAEGANAESTGFAPLLLQVIQGNYTEGIKEISFGKNDRGIEIEFSEADESYLLQVGFGEAARNVISIHGESYTIAVKGEFCQNEDGIPILKIDCDFLETPYSRSYKFFFDERELHAVFCETPAIELARNPQIFMGLLGENGQKLENILKKFDGDYWSVKLEKAFSPRIALREITEE